MARLRLFIICVLPIALGLGGCYADQKKQLQACEAAAPRTGPGQPLK